MLAGSKAQPGIEFDNSLALGALFFAPTWLDDEFAADADGFEIFFPGLGPILALDPGDDDLRGGSIDAVHLDFLKAGAELWFEGVQFFERAIDIDGDGADFLVAIGIDGGG